MTTEKATEKELIQLEMRYWQAIKERDFETALGLTNDPCIVSGAQGVGTIEKKKFEQMMKQAPYTLDEFQMKKAQVQLITPDVAIVAYTVHEELTVDGEAVAFDAAEASTWIRRDGQWRCALHTESLSGDPFGRDRRPN